MQPLLSICIPIYNRASIIREFLETIMVEKESNQEVELVINDHCSADDTEQICKKYSNVPNIKYFNNSKNENFWVILN